MNIQQNVVSGPECAEAPAIPAPIVRHDPETGWVECLREDVKYTELEIEHEEYELLFRDEPFELVGVRIKLSPEAISAYLKHFGLRENQALPIREIIYHWHAPLVEDSPPEGRFLKKFYWIGEELVGDAALPPEEWRSARSKPKRQKRGR